MRRNGLPLRRAAQSKAAFPDLLPWFAVPGRQQTERQILFGHWSTLGQLHWPEQAVHGLDSGCVWGGQLTALNMETGELTQIDCAGHQKPDL